MKVKRPVKIKNRAVIFSGLAFLVALSLFLGGCRREEPWDPAVAVQVDGRPIPKSAVDRVLEWGFHPLVDSGGQTEGAVDIRQILDKLIDEELILNEAEAAKLTVSEAELGNAAQNFNAAWLGQTSPSAELEDFKRDLRNYLLVHKMTAKIMAERRVLEGGEWRTFWEAWPRRKNPRYLVKALLIPPLPEPPAELKKASKAKSLEKLAEELQAKGLEPLLSDAFWMGGENLAKETMAALKKASEIKNGLRLTPPHRLEESWAIYEVVEVNHGPTPEEELLAAQAAFEATVDERNFQAWLRELRTKADIKINPALIESDS